MIYTQVKPCPQLEKYIDAFWTVKGLGQQWNTAHIFPDGCVDLILNIGEDCKTDNGTFTMKSGKSYLVGTMTFCKESSLNSDTRLLGIRFKPATFGLFYDHSPLHEIRDTTIEFNAALSSAISKALQGGSTYLNAYFLNRLSMPRHHLFTLIGDIDAAHGKVRLDALAKENYITLRQLERGFKKHLGITPKEYADIMRFRYALSKIRVKRRQENLLDVAVECGYYDHAHLAHDIKRYTGMTPSQF